LSGKPNIPTGKRWNKAVDEWRNLFSDDEAVFDKAANFDATDFEPFVTWGTSPGMSVKISGHVPDLIDAVGSTERESIERALEYMAVEPGQKITEIPIDRVFIGSCTNARIEDLRAAAQVIKGYKVAKTVRALVVPGSMLVKKQAEDEGVAQVFLDAGFEWRDAGCSMCLGMNDDVLSAGERCASTSNRNFEGRQGRGGRTHLLSPIMAAAAAVAGHFVDVRDWKFKN
jgi:3-isopropylmalate/(R)-2-methylmalate dehydratase large subunit